MSAPVGATGDTASDTAVGAGAPLVRCVGLVKRYGRTRALDGLDLTLAAGAPIALVGPNGAGKTTLMSVLAGFARPSGGTVEVLGRRPGGGALAGRLAALPQDALFDPRLSIGHQLRVLAELQGFGRRAARAEVARVLGTVGLDDVAGHRPTALSHGMRKRVALAQALLGEPALVLLDEPTAGVDPENARAIRELIAARGTTYLVSSHNLDELERLCGSVIQLERGALVRHESLEPGHIVDGARNGGTVVETTDRAIGARTPGFGAEAVERMTDGAGGGTGGGARGGRHGGSARDRATGGGGADELTVRLGDVPPDAFAAAAGGLDAVRALRQLPDGDWRLEVDDASAAAADLLALLGARDWSWRHVGRGRSLEERLYGR